MNENNTMNDKLHRKFEHGKRQIQIRSDFLIHNLGEGNEKGP
jgi:hypothetical protein